MTDIARAGAAHAGVLAALHAASFPRPWSAQEFAALLAQPGVVGWILNSAQPCGFILARAAADEAEVLTLAVNPDERRKGAASRLMQEAQAVLAKGGAVRMFLEVAADNAAALALYERHGFAPCGRRANYYGADSGPAIDAVVMMRTLI